MSKFDDQVAFQRSVTSETNCYITEPETQRLTTMVLVPDGVTMSKVHEISEVNDMVCTGTNVLCHDGFDVELRFEHISQTKLGENDD